MSNSDHQHATPFDDSNEPERLPEELHRVAQHYATLRVPRPTAEETSELIARLQASARRDQSHLPLRPLRRPQRVIPLLEALAAVLVVGVLIGSFLLVLALRQHQPATHPLVPASMGNILVSVSANSEAFSGNTTILANRASDGRQIWSYVTEQKAIMHPALSVQDHVVYAKLEDQVYALRASDGKLLWQTTLPWPSATPDFSHDNGGMAIDHGIICVQLYDDVSAIAILFALRATDGKGLWHYQTGVEERFNNLPEKFSLITIANGQVYTTTRLGNDPYKLVALQETTGRVLWSQDLAPRAIAVQDNIVYTISFSESTLSPTGNQIPQYTLLALKAQSGKIFWFRKVEIYDLGPKDMIIEKDKIILFNGIHFCAYQVSHGQDLWCTQQDPIDTLNGSVNTPFALVNDTLYATYLLEGQSIIQVEALDSNTRTVLWSKAIPNPGQMIDPGGLITIVDGKIFLLATQSISALRVNDGHQLWQHGLPFMILAIAAGN